MIDKFANANTNAMGNWHGGDEGMTLKYASNKLTITSPDADYAFYTQVSAGCSDFTKYKGSYLHIAYTGTTAFTVAFQQHNSQCKAEIAPYPETWDSAEASRYAKNGHIYIPMNHFNIDLARTIGIAIKGFYTSGDSGYVDEDGYLFVMGRTDDVINVAGHRLSTGSMEAVISSHPAVAECAVIGVADALKGQLPRGLVVLGQRHAGVPQRVERAGLDQRLDDPLVAHRYLGLVQEVGERGVAALLLADLDDRGHGCPSRRR